MDTRRLLNLFDYLATNRKNVQSVLIVRNGYLLAEAYFDPYRADTKHLLASASKSVTAMLMGMAIADGSIRDVNQSLAEFFPEISQAGIDPRKKDITLEHLLTMTAGLNWHETDRSYANPNNSLTQLMQQSDWLTFILGQTMTATPGEKFNYNSGVSHLLSAIIQKETGLTTAEYAEQNLFHPLGISDYSWEADPAGITVGGWGLMLAPRDMAKLGYLYLRNGNWQDQAIIPASWVAESTRKHLEVVSSSDFRAKAWQQIYRVLRRESAVRSYAYGYQWWIPAFGGYAARGHAGQAIFVIPNLDLVVVVTSGLPRSDLYLPEKLMEGYILPAVRSNQPLPPNPQALQALNTALQSYTHPQPKVAAALPPIAALLSGKRYQINPNFPGIQSLTFTFSQGSEAGIELVTKSGAFDLTLGLDDVYRTTPISDQEAIALRGGWVDDNTFTADLLLISTGKKYETSYTFNGDRINIVWRGVVEDKVWRMTGRVEE